MSNGDQTRRDTSSPLPGEPGYRSPAPNVGRGATFFRLVDGRDVEVHVAIVPDHISEPLLCWEDPENGERTFMHREGDHEVYREVHAYMLPLGELRHGK